MKCHLWFANSGNSNKHDLEDFIHKILQSLFLAWEDVILFMSQSRLHLIVTESVIYLAGLLDFTDLSVYFVAVIQCPLLSDGLIHLFLFACFFLISKQLPILLICLSHMLSRGFGHSSKKMRGVMHNVLCRPYFVLSQVYQVYQRPFPFSSFFITSTINFYLYIVATSLSTTQSEVA